MTEEGLRIMPLADLGESQFAWSFKIATNRDQHHPNTIETDAIKVLKDTKEVDLEGF